MTLTSWGWLGAIAAAGLGGVTLYRFLRPIGDKVQVGDVAIVPLASLVPTKEGSPQLTAPLGSVTTNAAIRVTGVFDGPSLTGDFSPLEGITVPVRFDRSAIKSLSRGGVAVR
jgi:hypothetical protein